MKDIESRLQIIELRDEMHNRIKVLERTGLTIKNCPKCKHPVLAIADWAQMIPLKVPRIADSHRCLTCGSKFTFKEREQLVEE